MSKNIPRIKGKDVNLCLVRDDDEAIETYLTWFSDENIAWRMSSANKILSKKTEHKWLDNLSEYNFNIVTVKKDLLIGNCSIELTHDRVSARIGIIIGDKQFHDKGYGTDALKLLIKFAFENLRVHNLGIGCVSGNDRAEHLYKKLGFVEYGREKEVLYFNGEYHDLIHMQMLERNYFHTIQEALK